MIDSNVYFNIYKRKTFLIVVSKNDEIGFQSAETTCKIVHNELI